MTAHKCRVFFIGAGPGDPELMTIKGRNCIKRADLILYAGSLVPVEAVGSARPGAEIVDSSSLDLEQTHALILETVRSGGIVARVHTGDPSLYGALKEQMTLLDREGIAYEVIPGVTAAFAAAARAKISFTLPEKTQTLIFTRLGGRTSVPEGENLRDLARHGSALAIYLSASDPRRVADELAAGGFAEDTPVIIAHRVGWPDESIIPTRLKDLVDSMKGAGIKRQAVLLVLPGQMDEPVFSKLYNPKFTHGFRKGEE